MRKNENLVQWYHISGIFKFGSAEKVWKSLYVIQSFSNLFFHFLRDNQITGFQNSLYTFGKSLLFSSP